MTMVREERRADETVDIGMIRTARERAAGRVRHTPLLSSPFLDEMAGRPVLLKAEVLQHTGSFKFRGAWSALTALPEETRARGVLAYSSGNHAQGVARAAQILGVPAIILMPQDAPALKIANTRAMGAEVILYDRAGGESREAIGEALRAERGLTLIKPFDTAQVVAGQGTCGLEIAADLAARGIETGSVLVCCGGGGLTAGVTLALAAEAPGLRVRPVEPEGFDDVARSLDAGRRLPHDRPEKGFADAILTRQAGEITFPILKAHCGPGLVVREAEIRAAMRAAFSRLKLVVEPGGAVALAAALFHGDALDPGPVVATLSGGNVDASLFAEVLAEPD